MTVKRITGSYWDSIPSTHIYLDELRDIVALCKENSLAVKMFARDYEFDEPEELKEVSTTPISDLDIIIGFNAVRVTFANGRRVIVHGLDSEAYALAHQIALILKDKVSAWRHRMKAGQPVAGFMLVANAIGMYVWPVLFPAPFVFGVIATCTLWVIISMLQTKRMAVVNPYYRREKPGFWERKGDDILVNVIVGAVTGTAGVVAGWFARTYFGK